MKILKTLKTLVSPLPDATQPSPPKKPKSDTAISSSAKREAQMEMTDIVKHDIKLQAWYYEDQKPTDFGDKLEYYSRLKNAVIAANSEQFADKMYEKYLEFLMKKLPFSSNEERIKWLNTNLPYIPFKPEYANEAFAQKVYLRVIKDGLILFGFQILAVLIFVGIIGLLCVIFD